MKALSPAAILSAVFIFHSILLGFPCLLKAEAQTNPPHAPLTYHILENGSIVLSDDLHDIAQIIPEIFTGDWQYHLFDIPPSQKGEDPGPVCDLGDHQPIHMKTTVETTAEGIHIHYVLIPEKTVWVRSVRVSTYLNYAEWRNSSCGLGKEQKKVREWTVGDWGLVSQADAQPLSLGASSPLEDLTLDFDPGKSHLTLVDNRRWTPTLLIWLGHNESSDSIWIWKAGEEKSYDFTLQFNRTLSKIPAEPVFSASALAGYWQGSMKGEEGQPDGRLSVILNTDSQGVYHASIIFDNSDLAGFSTTQPALSARDGVLRADYDNANLEIKLDAESPELSGTIHAWGKTRTFTLKRGKDFRFPRLDAEGKTLTQYAYQPPADLKDGLKPGDLRKNKTAFPEITGSMNQILDRTFPDIHSLLVARHGKLVMEDYFYGYGPQDPHALFSVTKSVFSTLFGITRDKGRLSLDQKLYDFYPDYRAAKDWDPRKDKITLGMMLDMTSGFQCDNLADSCAIGAVLSKDWLGYVLNLPLNHDPGTHWTYNGTSLLALSSLLVQKNGMTVPDFCQKYLEEPLGLKSHPWESGPNGIVKVDTGHWLTPREMMKLGLLYLNQGLWNGKRVLSKDWVQQASSKQAADFDYGYLFWLKSAPVDGKTIPYYEANGWGGQYIFIVPQADLVCVMTAGNYRMGVYFAMEEEFFKRYILAPLAE